VGQRPGILNHVRLSVRDVPASGRFYDPLMRCLGFAPEPRRDGGLAWGTQDATGRMQWLIHEVLVSQSAEIIEPPSEYDDEPDHYAVFFRDPDGVKLEVVHVDVAPPR
jgi:glyoxylase I family protein